MKHIGVFGSPLARLFLFSLLSLAGFYLADIRASAQNLYQTEDGKTFEVRLVPVEKEIFLNDRVLLKVEIRNLSDMPLIFLGPGGNRLGSTKSPHFKMTVTQPDGIVLPVQNSMVLNSVISIEGPSMAISPETIAPGQTWVHRASVPNAGLLLFPGLHRFSIEYKLFIGISDPRTKTPLPTRAETTIEAIPPDDEKIGRLIARLGEIMVTGNDSDAEEAAERLSGLKDQRRVPFFRQLLERINREGEPKSTNPLNGARSIERIVSILAFSNNKGLDPFLEKMLTDGSPAVRLMVEKHIAQSRRPDTLSRRIDLAGHPDARIRAAVAEGFKQETDPESFQIFLTMQNDDDPSVRGFATRAIEARTPPGDRVQRRPGDHPVMFSLKQRPRPFHLEQPGDFFIEIFCEGPDDHPIFQPKYGRPPTASVSLLDRTGKVLLHEPYVKLIGAGRTQTASGTLWHGKLTVPGLSARFAAGTYFLKIETTLDFKTGSSTYEVPRSENIRLGTSVKVFPRDEKLFRRHIAAAGETAAKDESGTGDEAIQWLATSRNRQAIPHLIKIAERYATELRDRESDRSLDAQQKGERFRVAVSGLTQFDDATTRGALQAFLGNPNLVIRMGVVNSILLSPHRTFRPLLIPMLNDPIWLIQFYALMGLHDSTDPEVERLCRKLLADENERVKGEAFRFLLEIRRRKLGY